MSGANSSKEYMRLWKVKNKDKVKAYQKAYYQRHKEKEQLKSRDRAIKHRMESQCGITLAQYKDMLFKAKGRCKLCKRKVERLVLDHCHKRKMARAFVCYFCNNLIGMIESPKYVELEPKIQHYLALFREEKDGKD